MTDDVSLITPEIAVRLLEEQPSIHLDVTLAEADLLVAVFAGACTLSAGVLAEKVRAFASLQNSVEQ